MERQKHIRSKPRLLDGQGEAKLLALMCGTPPAGQSRWTLKLLSNRLVELGVVGSISQQTVRQVLKNAFKPWCQQMWCIPPRQNTAFVCAMQQVLEVYKRPLDSDQPVVCMDESSIQCVKEVRALLPARPGQLQKYDAEYERNGVAHLIQFYAPFIGWHRIDVTDNHRACTWAEGVKRLVEEDFAHAKRITLVMDKLNTHSGASLYKALSAEVARCLLDKLEFVYTPRHGSWLNMPECEFSVLARQCLSRRLPDIEVVRAEVGSWVEARNDVDNTTNWRFTTEDARIKLKSLYPANKS